MNSMAQNSGLSSEFAKHRFFKKIIPSEATVLNLKNAYLCKPNFLRNEYQP